MHGAAHGDFGTATPDFCHRHTRRPVHCSQDATEDTVVGPGKRAGKFRGCQAVQSPARGREWAGLPGTGTTVWAQSRHTAGAQ